MSDIKNIIDEYKAAEMNALGQSEQWHLIATALAIELIAHDEPTPLQLPQEALRFAASRYIATTQTDEGIVELTIKAKRDSDDES